METQPKCHALVFKHSVPYLMDCFISIRVIDIPISVKPFKLYYLVRDQMGKINYSLLALLYSSYCSCLWGWTKLLRMASTWMSSEAFEDHLILPRQNEHRFSVEWTFVGVFVVSGTVYDSFAVFYFVLEL